MIEKKDSLIKLIGRIFAVLVVFGILIFVIFILFHEKRSEITTTTNDIERSSINCSANTLEDAFFILNGASQVNHNVKVLFWGSDVYKFFYSYEGKMRNGDDAKKAATSMNIKYDTYLGNHNYSSSNKVEETFNYDGNTVRINVYTNADGINGDTATFFFLEKDKVDELMKMNAEQLKDYYSKKGFVCDSQK